MLRAATICQSFVSRSHLIQEPKVATDKSIRSGLKSMAQFEHINATAETFIHRGQPVISVEKKELVGA